MPLPITQLNADTFEIFDRNVCEGWARWLRFFHSPRAQCKVDFEFRKGES